MGPGTNLAKAVLAVATILMCISGGPAKAIDNDPAKIVGPNACAECHKVTAEIWKGTHHFSTFTDLPRSKKARGIAEKMGVRRIKNESLCTTCHFTNQKEKDSDKIEAIAGISCESCHSAGADYIKVHSSFSGKKKETETPAEAKERWAKSEAAGMIRPSNLYGLAKNCFSCHVVPQEKLVNVGEHPAGSAFELVAWSQGEIRHNVWYTEKNDYASTNRQRMMFVVGVGVELETALRAVGKATQRANYAVAMAQRANTARGKASALAKKLPNVPELAQMAAAAEAAGLKLNNEAELVAAADKVAEATKKIASSYDGSTFGAIDFALPKPDAYKGKPAR